MRANYLVLFALTILLALQPGCAGAPPEPEPSLEVAVTSPQDANFAAAFVLRSDSWPSVILTRVPEEVSEIVVTYPIKTGKREFCESYGLSDLGGDVSTVTKFDGSHLTRMIRFKPERGPNRELYAANVVIKFNCNDAAASRRTYYLGFWYGPPEKFAKIVEANLWISADQAAKNASPK